MTGSCQNALLELLKAALFGKTPAFPERTDWEEVCREAGIQAVAPLCAPFAPEEAKALFAPLALQNQAHFMRILYEQRRLVDLFRENGISLVILKGTAAAAYYPAPARRTAGDIDCLVKPEEYDRAKKLLSDNGCSFIGEYYRHAEYETGTVLLELHRQYSFSDADVEGLLEGALDRAVTMEVNGQAFPAFPPPENGLILLDHMRHHFVSSGLGLRHLADWALFVAREMTPAFWEGSFKPLAEKAGLVTFAQVLTRAAVAYLGLPDEYPWCRDADEGLVRDVMERFFAEGNFGAKTDEESRNTQEAAMALRKKGFFRGLQSAGRKNWKASQKYAALRPFAWLYQLFRYLGKALAALLTGKNPLAKVRTGTARANLYRRLGIRSAPDEADERETETGSDEGKDV